MARALPGSIVKRVDHVNLRVPDPGPLYTLLTGKFQLPTLWTPAAMPGFEISAVGVGNVHIEPTRYGLRNRSAAKARAELFGIALQPESAVHASAELGVRGIPHTAPVPFVGAFPPASETAIFHRDQPTEAPDKLWTWVMLGGFFGDRVLALQYSSPLFQMPGFGRRLGRMLGRPGSGALLSRSAAPRRPNPFFVEWQAFDIAAARERAKAELERRDGGPLGVVAVREIIVGARKPDAEAARWDNLLSPAPRARDGAWELGDGPAIRIVKDAKDRIQALVWQVADVDAAARFLKSEGMMGAESDGQVAIAPECIFGLDIRLEQV